MVADRIRNVVGEVILNQDVVAERTVDRRGGVELHRRAQVILTCAAEVAGSTGPLRLDRNAVADACLIDVPRSDGDDAAAHLVAEDHWQLDDV